MGKIEALLTLGAIGAIGVIGYAVYRNAGKVGDLFAQSAQRAVTDPFSNWLDSLLGGSNGNGNGNGRTTAPPLLEDPNLLPEAAAPPPGLDPQGPPSAYAALIPGAKKSAAQALSIWNEASGSRKRIQELAEQATIKSGSVVPELTTYQTIVDLTRVSVGGKDPLTNKFYDFIDTAEREAIPLSREAVAWYRDVEKRYVREVYL